MLFKQFARWPARFGLILAFGAILPMHGWADDDNMLSDLNDTDDTPYIDNPWGGVVDGVITAPPGVQPAVDDDGHVNPTVFGPSISVGDLNGDGLPDIVMADPKGYFWYFPNHGTLTAPKFTTGEVMPIWLGVPAPPEGDDGGLITHNYSTADNIVTRIQLVDFSGEKRLSIVAGNFEGKLFFIHNIGSTNAPSFSMPNDLASITVPTYSDNHLWCNFLAPFLYDFTGNGHLDLIMGEGTYASNSIYLLTNKGNNGSPLFNEQATRKIIPGYGREHLTPQVVDWNNDGKPDIICGERAGYVDLFLNTSPDNNPAHLQFDDPPPPAPPKHITFGGQDQLGILTTIAVCDLTNNKLPNLIISNSDDTVSYALNKGKPGAPEFDLPAPVHAVNPFPKIFQAPDNWRLFKTFSMPYVLLVSTNVKDDPSFKPPEGDATIKSALKIYTVPHKHTYFNNEVYPTEDTHIVQCTAPIALDAAAHYDISFWVKTDGNVETLRYDLAGRENLLEQGINNPQYGTYRYVLVENQISASGDWTQVKDSISFEKADPDKPETVTTNFYLAFNGNGGSVWVTGFNMKKRAP